MMLFHEFFHVCQTVAGITTTQSISRIVKISLLAVLCYFRFRSLHRLYTQNWSNCCRHKYDQSISRIFHSNIWRVFASRPNCAVRGGSGWVRYYTCISSTRWDVAHLSGTPAEVARMMKRTRIQPSSQRKSNS